MKVIHLPQNFSLLAEAGTSMTIAAVKIQRPCP